MRPLAFLFVFLLSACALQAQQQERKLEDRIRKPNMDLEFNTSQSTFGTHGVVKTNKALTKDFGGNRTFTSKEFSSKSFGGTKQSWFASLFFSSKTASTKGKYEVPNAETKFDTKIADSKEAREGAKPMDTRDFVPADQAFLKEGQRGRWGRSQDRLDTEKEGVFQKGPLGYQGDKMDPLTIDDVRELLNKNK